MGAPRPPIPLENNPNDYSCYVSGYELSRHILPSLYTDGPYHPLAPRLLPVIIHGSESAIRSAICISSSLQLYKQLLCALYQRRIWIHTPIYSPVLPTVSLSQFSLPVPAFVSRGRSPVSVRTPVSHIYSPRPIHVPAQSPDRSPIRIVTPRRLSSSPVRRSASCSQFPLPVPAFASRGRSPVPVLAPASRSLSSSPARVPVWSPVSGPIRIAATPRHLSHSPIRRQVSRSPPPSFVPALPPPPLSRSTISVSPPSSPGSIHVPPYISIPGSISPPVPILSPVPVPPSVLIPPPDVIPIQPPVSLPVYILPPVPAPPPARTSPPIIPLYGYHSSSAPLWRFLWDRPVVFDCEHVWPILQDLWSFILLCAEETSLTKRVDFIKLCFVFVRAHPWGASNSAEDQLRAWRSLVPILQLAHAGRSVTALSRRALKHIAEAASIEVFPTELVSVLVDHVPQDNPFHDTAEMGRIRRYLAGADPGPPEVNTGAQRYDSDATISDSDYERAVVPPRPELSISTFPSASSRVYNDDAPRTVWVENRQRFTDSPIDSAAALSEVPQRSMDEGEAREAAPTSERTPGRRSTSGDSLVNAP
ncbi:uncharacterized protein PHACADRAFT_259905 [Phanerochaete carnosa HHB-10118-sp]|uniref:Uncharacterized protein n=1 Tax=Phanerochaete carnosa (strain HHB-10118-sp) TaxID=650164 RepID=K5VPV2_PHACS|nr:uncharacterized protein PHACADRAFT_259905 [Phanerochaete carnosa HHB-10118-sp]EKM53488.1 hypothetical protein PHACADRAFT_259905 [Phanerochaete carnosa HHB-10118-sp]